MTTNAAAYQKRLRGRPVEHRFGDAIATLNILADKDALTSVYDLTNLLDIDEGFAHAILDTLSDEHTAELDPLMPLCPTERPGERKRIGTYNPLTTKPLRLTNTQAKACMRACEQLGLDVQNPLYTKLVASYFPVGVSESAAPDEDSAAEEAQGTTALEALIVCAHSLAQAKREDSDLPQASAPIVTFTYHGKNDGALPARTRRIVPTQIYWANDTWLVDGFDLDIGATRTFSAAKMGTPTLSKDRRSVPTTSRENPDGGTVTLICTKEVVPRVLAWDRAELVGIEKDKATITIPYYRGSWLPRRILSLGSAVSYDNPKLRREVREVAKDLQKQARKLDIL